MASSIIQQNLKRLTKDINTSIRYKDLKYNSKVNENPAISQGSAVLNAYKIWLQSRKQDYHRQPNKAGFFDNLLNEYALEDASAELIKKDLIDQTKMKFPQVTVVACDVTLDKPGRGWKIKVVVKDNLTNMVGYDMAVNNESISVVSS